MRIFRDFDSYDNRALTAAAIGAFDGVHMGHRQLLAAVTGSDCAPAVITFDPLPSVFFGRLPENRQILTTEERLDRLSTAGIGSVILLPFNEALASMSAEEFISRLCAAVSLKKLVMGCDFTIGRGRKGNPERLRALGKEHGYEVEVIPDVEADGEEVSSTRIRALLTAGEVARANRLLGYEFGFGGKVMHGFGRGRELGYPTLNLAYPDGKTLLPRGVYATQVGIGGERYPAVTNIGICPTFESTDEHLTVESHLLAEVSDLYGKEARLSFVQRLRDEVCFPDPAALAAQIRRDIEQAKNILMNEKSEA